MEVRAAVLHDVGRELEIETLDLAPPQAGEVVIEVRAAGICHSDYHVMSGQSAHPLPVVLGHEGAGVVAAVGADVTKVAVGDHVVLNWIPACGSCFWCRKGQTHLCKTYAGPLWDGTLLDGTCRLSRDGKPYRHLGMLACWAERAVVPQESCVKIGKQVPFEVAALLGCAVTTGVGAVLNRAQVEVGSSVAVFGAGGVGLSVIMGAELAGADAIIAVDTTDAKAGIAKSFGATHFVQAGPQANREIQALTEGRGADYVFEAVGNTRLQEACLGAVRPGGLLVLVGLPGDEETMKLPSASFIRDEKTVTGSIFGSAQTERDFNSYGDLFLEGRLPVDRLISRRYPLEQVNEACSAMLSGELGRGVIVFEG